ncbi:hypothetical protein AAMO2058_000843000 [Amorphochlora amoebiformis]
MGRGHGGGGRRVGWGRIVEGDSTTRIPGHIAIPLNLPEKYAKELEDPVVVDAIQEIAAGRTPVVDASTQRSLQRLAEGITDFLGGKSYPVLERQEDVKRVSAVDKITLLAFLGSNFTENYPGLQSLMIACNDHDLPFQSQVYIINTSLALAHCNATRPPGIPAYPGPRMSVGSHGASGESPPSIPTGYSGLETLRVSEGSMGSNIGRNPGVREKGEITESLGVSRKSPGLRLNEISGIPGLGPGMGSGRSRCACILCENGVNRDMSLPYLQLYHLSRRLFSYPFSTLTLQRSIHYVLNKTTEKLKISSILRNGSPVALKAPNGSPLSPPIFGSVTRYDNLTDSYNIALYPNQNLNPTLSQNPPFHLPHSHVTQICHARILPEDLGDLSGNENPKIAFNPGNISESHPNPGNFSENPGNFSENPGNFSKNPGNFSENLGVFSENPKISPGESSNPGIAAEILSGYPSGVVIGKMTNISGSFYLVVSLEDLSEEAEELEKKALLFRPERVVLPLGVCVGVKGEGRGVVIGFGFEGGDLSYWVRIQREREALRVKIGDAIL